MYPIIILWFPYSKYSKFMFISIYNMILHKKYYSAIHKIRHSDFIIFLFAIIVSCNYSFAQNMEWSASHEVLRIRVLTYNIHHCNPPSSPGVIDPEAIATVIRQQQPDLVALQEVDIRT